MNVILFDDELRANFLPFTFTRPVCDIRVGILTIREKWEKYLNQTSSTLTQPYLSKKYPVQLSNHNLLINGRYFPDKEIAKEVWNLQQGEKLYYNNQLIALHLSQEQVEEAISKAIPFHKLDIRKKTSAYKNIGIEYNWDIFRLNEQEIIRDFETLTLGRKSQNLSETNRYLGNPEHVFIEEGAKMECSIINAESGRVYIGKKAEVMEGSLIRGSFALCEEATVKMGAKIYGATTVGPHSKVGGEINNSVIFGFSNKGHDGFLGNSVIGEWCNLGADTNNSNLKNNYGNVKVWSYNSSLYEDSKLQFCGLFMGDHSKSAINTMFNTGTVVGVSANVFGSGFPDKYVPSFNWGDSKKFDFEKACEVAMRVMERREIPFTSVDRGILQAIYNS